ncbi:hypothetical protein C0992_007729 [Termitomyces sp. T32_za158]|nr:hypothetical protein C0992_007729 [Termitomyces sp. T32_za158]
MVRPRQHVVNTTPVNYMQFDSNSISDLEHGHTDPCEERSDGSDDAERQPGLIKVLLIPNLNRSASPTLTDFIDPVVRSLLRKAIREYETLIVARNAFHSLAMQVQWATKSWNNAQDQRIHDIKDQDAQSAFKFQIASKYIKKNIKISAVLSKNRSFHYKFKNASDIGALFPQYFNPISLHSLALVLTAIDFCITEWSSGTFKKGAFTEKLYSETYKVFFEDLKKWHNLNPNVTTKQREKLFKRALKASGAVTTGPQPMLVGDMEERVHQELEGHTGDTDSEVDPGSGDDKAGGSDKE